MKTTNTQYHIADYAPKLKRSALRKLVNRVSQPGVLSFAGGLPSTELLPNAEFAEAMATVLAEDRRALQYGPPLDGLRAQLAQMMQERGVSCNGDDILLTTGGQQAIGLWVKLFLNPGGKVIVEEMIYPGFTQILTPYDAEILTVPTDLETGMDVDAVAEILATCAEQGDRAEMPACIYTIPTGHNPYGVTISLEKREQLVALARQYEVPIIEDDAYGFLQYDNPLPALRSLDPDWVFYVGSFSKIFGPGVRLGWTITPNTDFYDKANCIKEAVDLESSGLIQRAVMAYLHTGKMRAHLDMLRATYQQRRDIMLAALEEHFPAKAKWTVPNAGMFVWVEMPPHMETMCYLDKAIAEEKVAFVPAVGFATDPNFNGPPACHSMRLTFSAVPIDKINAGIAKIAKVFNN
jgi:2-aminoadipate transaminase